MALQATQGRETKLSRTFGDELCASRWLPFKSHYHLVTRANLANNREVAAEMSNTGSYSCDCKSLVSRSLGPTRLSRAAKRRWNTAAQS